MKKVDIRLEGERFYIAPLEGNSFEIDMDFYSISRSYLKEGVSLYRAKQLIAGSGGRPEVTNRVAGMYVPRGNATHDGHDRKRQLFDLVLEEFVKKGWKIT